MTDQLSSSIICKLNKLWNDISIKICQYDQIMIAHFHIANKVTCVDTTLYWPTLNDMLFRSNDNSFNYTIFDLLKLYSSKPCRNAYDKIKHLECSSIEELQIKLDLADI